MSTCQIFMLTCQLFMSTCQINIFDLTENYFVVTQTKPHSDKIYTCKYIFFASKDMIGAFTECQSTNIKLVTS